MTEEVIKTGWEPYHLDHIAQNLVLKYRNKDVLNESHKMRMAVAYGLERFWGEHLRLGLETPEGQYWKDMWQALADILKRAEIDLPNTPVELQKPPNREPDAQKQQREERERSQIQGMVNELTEFAKNKPDDQRVALSVLVQLCDALVWWTQRYKIKGRS
jgi:uncharacterized protein YdiU (UPF0061 family)